MPKTLQPQKLPENPYWGSWLDRGCHHRLQVVLSHLMILACWPSILPSSYARRSGFFSLQLGHSAKVVSVALKSGTKGEKFTMSRDEFLPSIEPTFRERRKKNRGPSSIKGWIVCFRRRILIMLLTKLCIEGLYCKRLDMLLLVVVPIWIWKQGRCLYIDIFFSIFKYIKGGFSPQKNHFWKS